MRPVPRDVQLDFLAVAGKRVNDRWSLARIVDEDLFTCAMLLPHHRRERLAILRVRLAKLAVLVRTRTIVAIRRRLRVLAPEQLHRDAGAAHFATYPDEIDRCTSGRLRAFDVRERPSPDVLLAHVFCEIPREPDALRAFQVVGHRTLAQPDRERDRAMFQPRRVSQPQNFLHLTHGHSLRHRASTHLRGASKRRSSRPSCRCSTGPMTAGASLCSPPSAYPVKRFAPASQTPCPRAPEPCPSAAERCPSDRNAVRVLAERWPSAPGTVVQVVPESAHPVFVR
jgi:hypothetical protein